MGVAQRNGSAKASNGHVNGSAKHASQKRNPAKRKRPGVLTWAFNQVARLATWFAILTILFRCPPSLEACDESSPSICKYYFQTKDTVVPHVQPYYDQYAAPYVEIVQPYYDTLNSKILHPARGYAVQYGAPYVEKAQEYGFAQWEKHGQPELDKIQGIVQKQYDQSVAPYLNRATDALGPYYDAAGPYYNVAVANGKRAFDEYILPGYEIIQPYALQGYGAASHFTTNTALPAAWWAWGKTYAFIDTSVWPHIRVLYLENVEPQLVRIGERLGRYKTKVKSKTNDGAAPSVDPVVESSFSKPTQAASSSTTSKAQPTSTAATIVPIEDDDDYVKPVEAPPAAENESEKRRKAREMVAEDLELWQNKFVERADEGANDMEDRIDEIATRMVQTNAQTKGQSLVDQLEASVKSEVESLKRKIYKAVVLADESVDVAEETAISAVRAAGVAIKERAQAVRAWRQSYDTELHTTVVKAADTHFQILDEIRGLALQEIGMRWAWTDGVTYKDWAKYHELKSTFGQWTNQLKQLIVSHPSLLEAQEVSSQIEDESMEIAAEAAKELGRLKEVAHLKIVAKDATDNFDLEAMKLAAEAAETAAEEALKAEEARKQAEATAKSAAEQARQKALKAEEEARKVAEEAARKAAEVEKAAEDEARAAASAVSETVEDGTSVIADAVEDFTSSAASVASGASEVIFDEASSEAESASSVVDDQSTAASQSVASILAEGSEVVEEAIEEPSSSVVSVVSDAEELAEDASSTAASAASVAAEDIFDEAEDVYSSASDSAESVFSDASSVVSEESASAETDFVELVSEASEAIVGETATVVGNVSDSVDESDEILIEEDPATEKDETPADSTASVKPVLFGAAAQTVSDRQPILEDYEDEDDNSGVISSLTGAAQEAYSNAVAAAADQYSSAASVVSAQIYGTPKPVHEQLFASVSSAYDGALAAASSRLSEALAAASSGASNFKATTTEAPKPTPLVDWSKVESIAAQRLNEGRLWAELQYQSAIIAMGLATPTPTSPSEKFYEQAKVNYYAGLGLAQARYSEFMARASSAMLALTATPTPTDLVGTASSIASVAKESAASAARAAEDAAEAVYSAAAENVASAINAVDEGFSSAIDAASENLYLTGVAVTEMWDNVLAGIEGQVYGEQKHIGWYESLFSDASSIGADATNKVAEEASQVTAAAGDSAAKASAEAAKQYAAVTELVSELVLGKEPSFTESVLSRLNAVYATASESLESYASEASAAASSVGDKVGSAASQATEAIKETINHARDEL